MEKVKYTLDRIVDEQYVFLKYLDEVKQLLIPTKEIINAEISEGDIVEISKVDSHYEIIRLNEETKVMKEKVSNILEKIKNKNNN